MTYKSIIVYIQKIEPQRRLTWIITCHPFNIFVCRLTCFYSRVHAKGLDGEPGAEPPPGADETFWPEWKRKERAVEQQRRRDDAESEAWVQGGRCRFIGE